jgi:hypothetical protein
MFEQPDANAAGLIDELWLHIAPITLGAGERLFDGVDLALEPVAGPEHRPGDPRAVPGAALSC